MMKASQKENVFDSEVLTRFDLYNSLFQALPFYRVRQTGTLLPFFTSHCEQGVNENTPPAEIIETFFTTYQKHINEINRFDLLFHFIQYIERQVVLFDAIEDSSFKKVTTEDTGSLQAIFLRAQSDNSYRDRVITALKDFSLRLVLTAHPTQFYPGTVLAIITDLNLALQKNDLTSINLLLQQLGKTPFFNKDKPTPVDEAVSLAWFMENVFYHATANVQSLIEKEFDIPQPEQHQLIELGFWPGGDRDGNPNVNTESTKSVSRLLRTVLFRCYYRDFRVLKRRITFRGVEIYMNTLYDLLYRNSFNSEEVQTDEKDEILDNLYAIKDVLLKWHNGLFIEIVDDLIMKVRLFGCYFASLDIRQDSRILRKAFDYCLTSSELTSLYTNDYNSLPEEKKIDLLSFASIKFSETGQADELTRDTLDTIRFMLDMQHSGGERASHRFIISNCQAASDILQLINLFVWNGWQMESLTVDFVPLFETVQDLSHAAEIMELLYSNKFYREHLQRRGNRQTIMLGFSDSTKDGGYLMANWSIFKAKKNLTSIARKHKIDLTFFDGRGGPPARGGGKTHRFYSSMGKDVANDHIQLTIQGQTISSQYGSFDTAYHNIEQLINAGITSSLNHNSKNTMEVEEMELIEKMAVTSHDAFIQLREDPLFLKYLEKFSPLKLLSQINISSRPVKRNSTSELKLEDLRAISFVTAWSQLKQNIPGFYGVGTALKSAKDDGLWDDVKKLYVSSVQFKTIIDNCMMSMSKSDFRVTAFLENEKDFSTFWKKLRDEFELTKQLLLELSGDQVLMEQYPIERKSIGMREKIVLPLILIQHYALQKLNEGNLTEEQTSIYNKLIIRTVYGIVNAGRNLA
ncbi:MAG TPA: phosphoenolpyruvate carboxylase [Sphingobacteriaceae bacterium]|nr:phosphoenolpyruvate carboxylase [Sphingobacteriaceae bacterium]